MVNGAGIVKDFSLHKVSLDGLADGYEMCFVQWAPRGGGFAFMGRPAATAAAAAAEQQHYELWQADWAHSGKTACACRQLLAGRRFNGATGPPFRWSPDGQLLLVKLVPAAAEASAPAGGTEQEQLQYYSTSVTALLDLTTGEHTVVGPEEGQPLSYSPWVGMIPTDAAPDDLAFSVTEPDFDGADRFALVGTLPGNVEVYRVGKTSSGAGVGGLTVDLLATVADAIAEAVLPGARLLLRRRDAPERFFIHGLGDVGGARDVDVEPSRL